MKIIVPGVENTYPKIFYCTACGCIFEATKYEYEFNIPRGKDVCKCPTCQSTTTEANEQDCWDQIAKILSQKAKEFEERTGQSIK